MKHPDIPHDDMRHLLAAEGWAELGDFAEANLELSQIAPKLHEHPHVLDSRWRIAAKSGRWEECVELARALTEAMPDHASGWINYAYALHELKRTQEAWDLLSPVAEKFVEVATIPYNLACYACQLGKLPVAEMLLEVTMKIDGSKRVKAMALKDKDLRPLWEKIREE